MRFPHVFFTAQEPDAKERWQRLSKAYDIASDPIIRKRWEASRSASAAAAAARSRRRSGARSRGRRTAAERAQDEESDDFESLGSLCIAPRCARAKSRRRERVCGFFEFVRQVPQDHTATREAAKAEQEGGGRAHGHLQNQPVDVEDIRERAQRADERDDGR